jgi:HSP20 family molecular chaperone IbpA
MSKVSIKTHSDNGKNKSLNPFSMHVPYIEADFKKGVLSVFMPKSEKAMKQQRKIKINE